MVFDKIINICYRILYSKLSLYPVNRDLDILFIYLNDIGIRNINADGEFDIIIEFNDNTAIDSWNSNRWYAFLSRGQIKFSNGETLTWNQSMPNIKILYIIKRM